MTNSKASPRKQHDFIYVIAGKETALVNAECDKLIDHLLEAEQRTTGLFRADADKVQLCQVLDELRTLPFLTPKRVVVIRGADDFISRNRQSLEHYFDNPSPTGVLVLTVGSWNQQTKLAKKLPQVGRLISLTAPKPYHLPGRLIDYAHQTHGKKLTRDTAELLVELTGDELALLYGHLDKLAIFAMDKNTITAGDVESLIGPSRISNAFGIIDDITAGKVAEAVNKLRTMFAEDKSSEFTFVGAMAFHLRRMFNAKVLLEKGSRPDQISKTLRIWGRRDAFFAQLRKLSLRQIAEMLLQLGTIDYSVKTGQMKITEAAEQFVLSLATS